MGYDEEETQKIFSRTYQLMKIFGDGKLTKEEWAKIDKMEIYDNDTKSLREQLPAEPTKEVLPDKSSIQQATAPQQVKEEVRKPTNQIEAFGMAQNSMQDYSQIGKRKIVNK
jgi:hypothetical protein